MSFGKSSSSSSEQQHQTGSQNQTQTPNNLPYLQTAWNLADQLGTGNNSGANAALSLLTGNAGNASNAANTGLNTAGAYAAPGGTANGANQYLTPFANGSMTGNNNPQFNDMVRQLAFSLQPQVDGHFAAAGRYGSGANANAFNTALTNEAGQLAYTNFNDSINRQLNAGSQLSANNSNSTNAALAALGLVPNLSSASTGAGQAAYNASAAPANTMASILALLGAGGGTSSGTSTGDGTASGSQSGTSFGFSPKFSLGPFSFGG